MARSNSPPHLRLSLKVAQRCEDGIGKHCHCRCKGKLHGAKRGDVRDLHMNDVHYPTFKCEWTDGTHTCSKRRRVGKRMCDYHLSDRWKWRRPLCAAILENGKPCRRSARAGKRLCWTCDPERLLKKERRDRRKKIRESQLRLPL